MTVLLGPPRAAFHRWLEDRFERAAVSHTSARIAIPPICSGHIDRVIRRHSRCHELWPDLRCRRTSCHPRLANLYRNEVTDSGIVGRVLFVDGVTRDVYEDAEGRQWAIGYDGECVYGVWLMPPDEPLVVEWGSAQMRSPSSTGIQSLRVITR
jgi:hypothetical protein